MRARRPATAAGRRVHLANFALVAAFVLAVYVVIVVGGGALLGHTAAPSLPLSVLATTVVALALEPVRRAAAAATSRTFAHGAMSPYDVLSRFSETVTGGYDTV